MSIAQGIATGYNLVQGTKQFNENARLREQQLADNAAYREQSLGLQRQQIEDLAQYRADNLALQEKIAGMEDTYKTLKLQGDIADDKRDDAIALAGVEVQKLSAKGALTRAETAAAEMGLKVDEAKALADFAAADNLYTLSQADLTTRTRLQPIADAAFKQLEGSTNINLDALAQMDIDGYNTAYLEMLNGLKTGQLEQVSNVQMAAITDMIGLANTQSIGKKITPEAFPAAPPEYEGYTITEIVGHDGAFVESGAVRGELGVKLRAPDGSNVYYYPDLTEYRGGDTAQLLINMEDGTQKFGGTALMYSELQNNPVFMKYIDDNRVEKRGGAEKVDEAVQARVDQVENTLKASRDAVIDSVFIDNNDLHYLVKPGDDIAELLNNMGIVYERARNNYLYGTSTQDKVDDARSFSTKLRELMPNVQVDTGDRSLKSSGAGGRNTVRGNGVVALTDLIGESNMQKLGANQMAYLNAMITSPDDLTIPAEKFERLQEYLINQGLMARP